MTIVCTALMLMLLAFSDAAMDAALTAARCFAQGVMPALAPMMVLGKMLPDTTKPEHSALKRCLCTVLFAFAAGSPAAAQRAVQLKDAYAMSDREWETLLCLTGVMSPMFFTGTLGRWLGSTAEGFRLLLIHWAGAAAAAGLWYAFSGADQSARPPARKAAPVRAGLSCAIASSAQSLLCVCGAMVVFSAAACLVKSVLGIVLPRWTAQHPGVLAAVWAALEIGGGSAALCTAMEKPQAALSALCGFGGVSILLQNLLFLESSVRPVRLIGMRAVHALASAALALLTSF